VKAKYVRNGCDGRCNEDNNNKIICSSARASAVTVRKDW